MADKPPIYIIASDKPWGIRLWNKIQYESNLPGNWLFADKNTLALLVEIYNKRIRYIFFAHWSEIVPDDIINNYECVCFHPSDLPYGRGGTPIQNQITLGITLTSVTAFRMTSEIDAGPIYGAYKNFSLEGSAEEIYVRMLDACYELINWMVLEFPTPTPQPDIVVVPFKRRKAKDSQIVNFAGVDEKDLFDHIRMLDAEGYPLAYIDLGDYRIEFKNAARRTWGIEAQVKIWKR